MSLVIERGFIIVAPFSYTDMDVYKMRPALVVSNARVYDATGHVIVAMITAGARSNWSLDVSITAWKSIGLLKPSRVRLKLFTVDVRSVDAIVGELDNATMDRVQQHLSAVLGRDGSA